MKFIKLMDELDLTVYSLSKKSGVAKSTIFDIYTGRSNVYDCKGRVLLNISKALNITIEDLLGLEFEEYNSAYETSIPVFLKESIDNIKRGAKNKDLPMDCYIQDAYSSINICEVENIITPEHANYLRRKYVWRKDAENSIKKNG